MQLPTPVAPMPWHWWTLLVQLCHCTGSWRVGFEADGTQLADWAWVLSLRPPGHKGSTQACHLGQGKAGQARKSCWLPAWPHAPHLGTSPPSTACTQPLHPVISLSQARPRLWGCPPAGRERPQPESIPGGPRRPRPSRAEPGGPAPGSSAPLLCTFISSPLRCQCSPGSQRGGSPPSSSHELGVP